MVNTGNLPTNDAIAGSMWRFIMLRDKHLCLFLQIDEPIHQFVKTFLLQL
jgi:hypothetical protein